MMSSENQVRRVFDNSHESLVALFEEHPKGVVFTCPKCGVDLQVALSKEEALEKKVHPGVYCPIDPSHVWRMFNLSGSPREKTAGQ
jgi:hypothetical protein